MRAAELAAAAMPAEDGGLPTAAMMEMAGAALAAAAMEKAPQGPVAIFCGPGGNGGDGFVAARGLRQAGREVRVGLFGDREKLIGDQAMMAGLFAGEVAPADPGIADGAACIIDCLFGAGLSRPLEAAPARLVEAVNERRGRGAFVIAADLPSGAFADGGALEGPAISADITLAFGAKKPCHLLYPARALCGEVIVIDVRIADAAILAQRPQTFENGPALWGGVFPQVRFDQHKYQRGGVAVVAGPRLATGAARLAARSALRVGAGAATLYAEPDAASECAAQSTAVMVRTIAEPDELARALGEGKTKAAVIGPGGGVGERTEKLARTVAASAAAAVFDADALTTFADNADDLFGLLRVGDVLTPHLGEFARVFPDLAETASSDRLGAARTAAARAGAILVLKGPDTVIAAPDGRAAINANAPPHLATAGAGDVLAGFIAGLLAQGMPGFEAAAAGVWLHGACGQIAGRGLIAEDLPEAMPAVYRALAGDGAGGKN